MEMHGGGGVGCLVVGDHEGVMSRWLWQRERAASWEAHQAAPT